MLVSHGCGHQLLFAWEGLRPEGETSSDSDVHIFDHNHDVSDGDLHVFDHNHDVSDGDLHVFVRGCFWQGMQQSHGREENLQRRRLQGFGIGGYYD